MSLLSALSVSASGMSAQRERTELLVENLANSDTTRTPEGGPYRRKDAVFTSDPTAASFSSLFDNEMNENAVGVRVAQVVTDTREPEKRYTSAGECARAFERVLKVLEGAASDTTRPHKQTTMHSQLTLPPTVNWFDEEIASARRWQLMPPVVTGKETAVQAYPQAAKASSSQGEIPVPEQGQVSRYEAVVESTQAGRCWTAHWYCCRRYFRDRWHQFCSLHRKYEAIANWQYPVCIL